MQKEAYDLLENTRVEASQIIERFNKQTVERGFQYFKLSKIFSMTIKVVSGEQDDDAILIISAQCSGTHQNIYQSHVEIFVRETDTSSVKVVSDCSCPVGYDCKHGVALLFEFLDNIPLRYRSLICLDKEKQKEKVDASVSNWLESIKNIEGARQAENEIFSQTTAFQKTVISANFQVVYILNCEADRNKPNFSQLIVEVKKIRRLKNGGFGRANYCDLEKIQQRHYDLNCSELDVDIARSLKAFVEPVQQHYYNRLNVRPMQLKGELGAFVLEQMLRCGHCYWQSTQNPVLQLDQPKDLQLSWQEKGQQLSLQASFNNMTGKKSEHILFKLSAFYYLDLEQQSFHKVVHPKIPFEHLLYLLSAPAIPKSKAREVSKQLLELFPNTQMPLPDPNLMKIHHLEATVPVKILKLRGVYFSKTANKPELMHCASLSFDYQGQEIISFNLTDMELKQRMICTDGQRFLIDRNLETERAAFKELATFGLNLFDQEIKYFGISDLAFAGESRQEVALLWQNFKENIIPELLNNNWLVSIEESFDLSVENAETWFGNIEEKENSSWFEMSLGFNYKGQAVNLLPILVDLLKKNESSEQLIQRVSSTKTMLVEIREHQWVNFPSARIVVLLKTLVELYDQDSVTLDGHLIFSKHAALHYSDVLNEPDILWKGAADLLKTSEKLRSFKSIQEVDVPKNLKATLRDYQKEGLAWLQFLREYRFDGILADDMGLGKTIQAIANILLEKNSGRATKPTLIIAPTSLMGNWYAEIAKFAPSLKVLILQGSARKKNFSEIENYDVILTTYPLMLRDSEVYFKQKFHYMILDEAQAIKNPKSKSTQVIFSIHSQHRLCLTGTPIENHLGELWSMFNFLMPGYLGAARTFKKLFRTPIEKDQDMLRQEQLRKRITPFMLRRSKDLVAQELPAKTEIIRQVSLSGMQRDLYETVRLAMDKKVRDEIKKKGLNRSQIIILDALLKLRQVCCDPRLVKLDRAKDVKESAKLEVLLEMLTEMLEKKRKVLIFSQFTSMLLLIEAALKDQNFKYTKLTGRTKNRAAAVAQFQTGDAEVFLISLKAGGVGLNLTAADTVIHYDPWWNPAVERQATDRAHRIGQDKPVFVYKLIAENTVEEKIVLMQQKKQKLADAMYGDKDQKIESLGRADLLDLLQPLQ